MRIDREWLEKHEACNDGKEFFLSEGVLSPIGGVQNLLNKNKIDWANWLVVRLLTCRQKIVYASYAAQHVLRYFEKEFPLDKRPRLAIASALRFVKRPTYENRDAANAAAYAAYAAAITANAATAAYATATAANAAIKRRIVLYGLKILKGAK